VAATQHPRDRFPSRRMSESPFRTQVVGGYLKCSSVPDFRGRSFALQVRGVKWTSPQPCSTHLETDWQNVLPIVCKCLPIVCKCLQLAEVAHTVLKGVQACLRNCSKTARTTASSILP